jgi:hypothetical protein
VASLSSATPHYIDLGQRALVAMNQRQCMQTFPATPRLPFSIISPAIIWLQSSLPVHLVRDGVWGLDVVARHV